MPRIVENAGGELSAGYLFKCVRHLGKTHGTTTIGGRTVAWELAGDGVRMTHPPADHAGVPVTYTIATVATVLPSGGSRRWWACPECGRRVDALYLPAERERLGCRRCCALTYTSQLTAARVAKRKERPGLWTERRVQRWEWDRVELRMVQVADRFTRRRL